MSMLLLNKIKKMPQYTRTMTFDDLGNRKRMPDEVADTFTDGDETTMKAPRLQSGYFQSLVQREGEYDEQGNFTGTKITNAKAVENKVIGWERNEVLSETQLVESPEDFLIAQEELQQTAIELGCTVEDIERNGVLAMRAEFEHKAREASQPET